MVKHKYCSGIIITAFFCIIICFPVVSSVLQIEMSNTGNENRQLNKIPEFYYNTMENYPKEFEAYFNDHFNLRRTLLNLYQWYKIKLLKESPSPKVIMGKDKWLYYKNTVDQYRSGRHFREKELGRWRDYLLKRSNKLGKRGISYFFIIAPNKASVYPEYIPAKYNRIKEDTHMDQFVEYFMSSPGLAIIDLRSCLGEAKKRFRVYHHTDTHWNHIGIYFAYEDILKKIKQSEYTLSPIKFNSFEIVMKDNPGGDLAGMIGDRERIREEDFILTPGFTPPGKRILLRNYLNYKWPGGWKCPFLIESNGSGKTLLVIGDSFFIGRKSNLPNLLSKHFKRSYFLHRDETDQTRFEKIIETEAPDIVIEEIVERNLFRIPKTLLLN